MFHCELDFRLVGPSVAKELMFTARVFNGAEASKVRFDNKLPLQLCICRTSFFL